MTTADTTFKVTGQQETTEIDGNGNLAPVISVAFTTGQGVSGTVNIPKAQYTVDNVRSAILAQAQILDSVAKLTG